MNTVNTHREGEVLQVQISGGFNLHLRNMIENHITKGINKLEIDLSACELIDSEGVIFMYEYQRKGGELVLNNPPQILFEILDILELREQWDHYYSKSKEQ